MKISIFGRELTVRKSILALSIILLASILGLSGYFIMSRNDGIIIRSEAVYEEDEKSRKKTAEEKAGAEPDADTVKTTEKEEIQVYIVGCVKKPGLVTIKKGDLINDAIAAAGGATGEADLDNVNLAYRLNENTMIRVKSKKDERAEIKNVTKSVPVSNKQTEAGDGVELIVNSGGAVLNDNKGESTGGKVNLNGAAVEQLDSLPGIGVETAKDIIAFREKSGPFKRPEDIMKVPGIKGSKYNKIKDLITVE